MEAILSLFVTLLVLGGLIAAVAYGVVALTRRGRDFAEVDPGIGTVRRLYFYGMSLVGLTMAANGVVQIAVFLLDAAFGGDVLSPSRSGLAIGLALTIVGLPLWAAHWRFVGKYVRELPVETCSVVRKSYTYIVLAIAASIGIHAAVSIVQWLLGDGGGFMGYSWAALAVWGAVWAFHWRLEAFDGQATPETRAVRRMYIYSVAAAMLMLAAVGVGQLVHVVLREAYEALTSMPLLAQAGLWRNPTREALSLALVAGPIWAAHWLYFARHDYESILRQIYVFALGVFGGVSTLMTATGIVVYQALVWTIGVPEEAAAADHFRFLPGVLASLMTGGAVLTYHALAARADSESYAIEPQRGVRSYPYALSALGLGTLAGGIVTLVSMFVGLASEGAQAVILGQDSWRNVLSLSITLSALGLPLWGYYWAGAQRRVNAGDAEERGSLARRIFIFATLGVGMLALVGSVSFLIFVFLRELLDGDLTRVLPDTKASIGIIVAGAVFVPYYWLVYRADRRATPDDEEKPLPRKAVTVLLTEGAGAFLSRLEAALGHSVNPLPWVDADAGLPELSDAEVEDLAARIGEAAGLNVLLVPDGEQVRVLSYR